MKLKLLAPLPEVLIQHVWKEPENFYILWKEPENFYIFRLSVRLILVVHGPHHKSYFVDNPTNPDNVMDPNPTQIV